MPTIKDTIRHRLSIYLRRLRPVSAPAPRCDSCACVEFFRSNGDGQVTRLHAFCRCPGGPYEDRPVPAARTCDHWLFAVRPPKKPRVGDPDLTV